MNKQISSHNLFPLQLAVGDRFCNRFEERKFIEQNIAIGQHLLIMSPRRYGKTSLVNFVLKSVKFPVTTIDLFVAYDDETICRRICDGVSAILRQTMPFSKKILHTIAEHFQTAQVTLTNSGLSLQLNFANQNKDPVGQVNDLLTGLDALLKSRSKRAIVFIDEFQDLAKAEHSEAFQGALRNVAQKTENIIFIFSGSSRRLLSKIFEDRSKPLYKLCKKMNLTRISKEHYYNYIQSAAQTRWEKLLKDELIDYILELTELHPFYINLICGEIWNQKYPASRNEITAAWEQCFIEEKRTIETELSQLSANQIKLLEAIAQTPKLANLFLQDFLQTIRMSNSSVQRALKFLLDNDWIYKNNQYYEIIDPLLKLALIKLSNNNWL